MRSVHTSPLLLKVHLKTWTVAACSSLRLRRGTGFSFTALLLSPESSEVAWKGAEFVGCVGDPKVFILFVATKVSMTDNFYLSCPNGLIPSRDIHGQNGNQREDWCLGLLSAKWRTERRWEGGSGAGESWAAHGSRSDPVAAAWVPRGSDNTSDKTAHSRCSTSTRSRTKTLFWKCRSPNFSLLGSQVWTKKKQAPPWPSECRWRTGQPRSSIS